MKPAMTVGASEHAEANCAAAASHAKPYNVSKAGGALRCAFAGL